MATQKTGGRRYGAQVSRDIERQMKEMKAGKLKSGGNGQTVTNPKQAIAIALSEARKKGEKVPPPGPDAAEDSSAPPSSGAKKTGSKKSAAKKASAKKTAAKASSAKTSSATKAAPAS